MKSLFKDPCDECSKGFAEMLVTVVMEGVNRDSQDNRARWNTGRWVAVGIGGLIRGWGSGETAGWLGIRTKRERKVR